RPEVPAGQFCLHPRPHREKIPVFGASNGAIPAGIRSDGCKLTTLSSTGRNVEIASVGRQDRGSNPDHSTLCV
ncbi:hypothetical protein A2U01_0073481, partial [Trifolium medium]|nr:hypothetical protein [Trifolium medium]